MIVEVYRNLTKGCWSVRDAKTRLVIDHKDELTLANCAFKVSEAGRQRVLKEKRKNVHAVVKGLLLDWAPDWDFDIPVRYNPYESPFFRWVDAPLFNAPYVQFRTDGTIRV